MTAVREGLARTALADAPPELRATWAAARVWAAHRAPYLATAVLALQPVVVTDIEAAGPTPQALRCFPVDGGWRVYLHPHWLETTSPDVVGFWLLHQVGHLLRQHGERFATVAGGPAPRWPAGRTPEQHRWGVAADCEINDDVPADLRARDAVVPASVGMADGRTAEEYWQALTDLPAGQLAETADCGSGADGVARAWDGRDGAVGGEEARLLRRETARAIAAHAREHGDVPGGWQRWADEVIDPAVDWRRELSAALRLGIAGVAGRVDYTYRRPSRRSAAVPGVILPALRQPVPRVTVVLDTSQSMSSGMLGQAVAEVGGVLRSLGVHRDLLRVLCCDSSAQAPARVLDARSVELVGGGGTDLRAGLAAAAAGRPRPDLIVVLTDGGTDWPDQAPRGCSVVIGLLDEHRRPPSWARVVRIPTGGG